MSQIPRPNLLPGIYLAHKPVGLSSFDVVRHFKRVALETGQKKWTLGHGGTLDPFAQGLLLILSGQATRLMELIHPLPKIYEADIEWGAETDTGDHLGRIISEGHAGIITEETLNTLITDFLGWSEQVPPATSAKKIGGEAAYKKAHRGEDVVLPPSRVYLHDAVWLSHDLPKRSRLKITCRGGYYVRSLARDMGRILGCGAHLSGLYRTGIGPWAAPACDSQHVAETSEQPFNLNICNCPLITGTNLLSWCRCRTLSAVEADHLAHGRPIEIGEITDGSYSMPNGFPDTSAPVAAFFETRLIALLKEREQQLWTIANLRGGL